MINALWAASGGGNYFDIIEKYKLNKRVMTVGSALIELRLPQLLWVCYPAMRGESFVVKTHSSPNAQSWRILSRWFAHSLIVSEKMIPIYLIRDPRDAVLSGYEYGQRGLDQNKPNAFSHTFRTVESGIGWMENYLKTCWQDWKQFDRKLLVKYEDQRTNFHASVRKILDYLNIDADDPKIIKTLENYQPGAEPEIGTHFHKAEVGRFRHEFSTQQQADCNQRFAPYLAEMGYDPA